MKNPLEMFQKPKPYSRDEYDKKAKAIEEKQEEVELARHSVIRQVKISKTGELLMREGTFTPKYFEQAIEEIKKEQGSLKKLEGQAQSEALDLNQEYDALLERAKTANLELLKFQQEKLGMRVGGDQIEARQDKAA